MTRRQAIRLLQPKEIRTLEKAGVEISALRREKDRLELLYESARLRLENRWQELTTAKPTATEAERSLVLENARKAILDDAAWRFEEDGTSAHFVDGRLVVVPGSGR